jgi:hypothetical protein
MKVELEKGVWLCDGDGDCDGDCGPARTLLKENATDYSTMRCALQALEDARTFRPFKNAVVCDDFLP